MQSFLYLAAIVTNLLYQKEKAVTIPAFSPVFSLFYLAH